MNAHDSQPHDLAVGQQASVSRVFTREELSSWRRLGAAGTADEVPEPLIGGLFAHLLGERLPGRGTDYLRQEMRFESQARVGERLTATATVSRLQPETMLVALDMVCNGEDGRTICRGEALVLDAR